MENPNGVSCKNKKCKGKPTWADGAPVNNSNGYIAGGIVVSASDTCFLLDSDGSISGHQYRKGGRTLK
jgi:hypothetical protein